jgi:hypothetical protein
MRGQVADERTEHSGPGARQDRVVAAGFRVKSGWACAVVLVGAPALPHALDRRVIALSDPNIPESRQPYHAGMGKLEEDRTRIEQRSGIVRRAAAQSIAGLIGHYATAGWAPRHAGIVVGSQANPARIHQPHIRAHALEGQLFRSVLEESLQTHGLTCTVIVEGAIYAKVATLCHCSEEQIKKAVSGMGDLLGKPWRAEEKLAAAAAWMALADLSSRES